MKVFKHLKLIWIKNRTFNVPLNIFLFNKKLECLQISKFLPDDMKLVVLKKYLGGQILYRSVDRRIKNGVSALSKPRAAPKVANHFDKILPGVADSHAARSGKMRASWARGGNAAENGNLASKNKTRKCNRRCANYRRKSFENINFLQKYFGQNFERCDQKIEILKFWLKILNFDQQFEILIKILISKSKFWPKTPNLGQHKKIFKNVLKIEIFRQISTFLE